MRRGRGREGIQEADGDEAAASAAERRRATPRLTGPARAAAPPPAMLLPHSRGRAQPRSSAARLRSDEAHTPEVHPGRFGRLAVSRSRAKTDRSRLDARNRTNVGDVHTRAPLQPRAHTPADNEPAGEWVDFRRMRRLKHNAICGPPRALLSLLARAGALPKEI